MKVKGIDNLASDPFPSPANPIERPYDRVATSRLYSSGNWRIHKWSHSPKTSASSNQLNQQVAGYLTCQSHPIEGLGLFRFFPA